MFQKPTNHSMSGFVVCNCFLFVRLQNICFLLQSCNDSFYGCFKVLQEGKINFGDKTLLRREWKYCHYSKLLILFTLWIMDSDNSRAAIRAASLQTFATSAPVIPGVRADNFLASSSLSTLVFRPSKCTLNIEARP